MMITLKTLITLLYRELECAVVNVLSSSSAFFTELGGTGSFDMTTASTCPWETVSNAAWLTITSNDNGIGSTTVSYTLAANPGIARNSTITIGDQTFTVYQSIGCDFTLSPHNATFPANGGIGQVIITASDASCPWTTTTDAVWMTIIVGENGTGNGVAFYAVASNNGTDRTDTITLGRENHTINQTGVIITTTTVITTTTTLAITSTTTTVETTTTTSSVMPTTTTTIGQHYGNLILVAGGGIGETIR